MSKYWHSADGNPVATEADFKTMPPGFYLAELGGKSGDRDAPAAEDKHADEVPDSELIAMYEAKFGKKPHHSMKAKSIKKALEAQE